MSTIIAAFLLAAVLCGSAAGCATAPKPKTVGQTIGSAIDSSVTWASKGIQKLLKK